jgi:transposase
VLKSEASWLRQLIERDDDLTIAAITAWLLAERGVKADVSMRSRFFQTQRFSKSPQ